MLTYLLIHAFACNLKFASNLSSLIFFSLNGENKHHGCPTNPAVPHRVPGGSCSGAAVAVAAELVDFSLGEPPKVTPADHIPPIALMKDHLFFYWGYLWMSIVSLISGIDTVGGVRIPAAYCGILGFRSSHGVVSNVGTLPISTSLDAVGMCVIVLFSAEIAFYQLCFCLEYENLCI